MKRKFFMMLALTIIMVLSSACSTGNPGGKLTGIPAGTDFTATGSPSATHPDLQEVTGVVKEIKQDLILLSLAENGEDFRLRFSENSKWGEGIGKEILMGNTLDCLVKLEPTFTTPSQGEVYEVISNTATGR
jgi:hypothetical protein